MKRIFKKIRNLSITMLTVITCAVFVTSAWGTLALVKSSSETSVEAHKAEIAKLSLKEGRKPRSRAPEPTTMAMFGSGIFGMILSFLRKTYRAAKRGLDIVAGIVGVVCLSPLFLLAAVLIKLTSKGPVFFTQTRVGKDGKLFEIYKFRTMKVEAEKESGPVWASENDTRLIPVGSFLRKAHIDEIPQFLNIIKGEMSLIGPRPERPIFVEKFKREISDYEKRLAVKPGLTGMAQVWHKYDETLQDVKKKIKYDVLYIKRLCLWTDLGIFLRTFRVVFTGEGAR